MYPAGAVTRRTRLEHESGRGINPRFGCVLRAIDVDRRPSDDHLEAKDPL